MKVIQCWDDGIVDDVRLTHILRRYNARGTFCLNPGLYQKERSWGWLYGDKEVWRLGIDELPDVYNGFEICSHSMTHPNLTDISSDHLYWEVMESKNVLQNIFKKPVCGFCYPFNAYNESVKAAVRSTGYVWARGSNIQESIFPPHDPLEFHFCCRYPSPDFWTLFNNAKKANSVFSFWGHSYELLNETMWKSFEETIEKISSDPETTWSFITELFIKE